ncbi:MAG TPA: glutaredoxin family protein [Rhodoferax sp.]
MKNSIHQINPKTRGATAAICAALLLAAGLAQAQTIYRVVGPDGKVTFSDKPPVAAANVSTTEAGGKAMGTSGPALPFELRQVVSKYPVTLYTSSKCAPCESGRALLSSRGIPFTEKTVNTAEDSDALQRISDANSLPFLTIGGQQIKGFSDSEWTQFLDAAAYPKASVLPTAYRNPAKTPLVVVQQPAPAAKAEENQNQNQPKSPEPSQTPVDKPSNPAGIKF